MQRKTRVSPGRLLALVLTTAAFAAVLGGGTAFAAEDVANPADFEDVFQQLQNTPVYKDMCTKTCHGNIAKTKNYSSAIIFQHGYHQLVACSSCHPRFPHRADATIERPEMKGCFDCHGLRHGPMGLIASGECEDCHVTPKERLRPAFHSFGWNGKPHVDPANKEFNTRCAMCHEPASCTDCHDDEGIRWAPEKGWAYDSVDGCQSCHGNAALTKQQSGGVKSFEVSGIEDSAHADTTCQQCHIDYRFDDQPSPSALWTVNVGTACAQCHADNKDKDKRDPVHLYEQSAHATALKKGNSDSATCASCHGGHFIYRLDTEYNKARMQASSYRTCARCKQHGDEYDTYDDYYHGKAYKSGAPDSPACWDCHKAHDVLPREDASSSVNPANVGDTCGQDGCHKGSNESFGTEAAALIHEKVAVQEKNPLQRLINTVTGR